MSTFHYTAINKEGKKQKGVIEAETEKHARHLLREKNVTLLKLEHAPKKRMLFKRTLSRKELVLLTRQLATLISAGLPIEDVLTAVSEQTEKPRTKGLMLSVRNKVREGHALASALRDFPAAFPVLYSETVAAGEKSGKLSPILNRLADYIEQQFTLHQKIRNALIYPALMVSVSIAIVGFLLTYVVPHMVAVYQDLNQTLPLVTQILIGISSGLKNWGVVILVGLMIVLITFYYALRHSAPLREQSHHFYLRIPLLGNKLRLINTARFARTLAILSSSGISILEAIHHASQLMTLIPLRKAIEEAAHRIREGASISLAFKQAALFPPMSLHLIASGETSGQLDNMLERAANNQENTIRQWIDVSLALFEPIMILVMGGMVLFIVLAIMLPIFQLNQ